MSGITALLYCHIVFSTKKQEPCIPEELRRDMHAYIGVMLRRRNGELLAAGGMSDHIHLLVRLSPDRTIEQMVRDIKVGSAIWLQDRGVTDFQWQEGDAVFSVGPDDLDSEKFNIEHQAEHHTTQSYRDEYIALLVQNGVEYDERDMWD